MTHTIATCQKCGRRFSRSGDESWKRLCLACYIQRQQEREARLDREVVLRERVAELTRQVQRLETLATTRFDEGFRFGSGAVHLVLDPAFLTRVIALTHPDRHPTERAQQANDVTRILLELRKNGTRPWR